MKKGITPVVAIVLLLLLTISAAGAAFAFSQNIIGQNIEEGEQQAASSLDIKDITCKNGTIASGGFRNNITVQANNDGDVDLNNAEIYLYQVQDGSLFTQNTTGLDWTGSEADWPADQFTTRTFQTAINTSGVVNGDEYRVELQFDNGYTATSQCTGN